MGVSLIDIGLEQARQARTGDTNYADRDQYALVVKSDRVTVSEGILPIGGVAVFPLPAGLVSMNYSLPFAAEVTPMQEGGVVKEEGGITLGDLSIEGTTGFKLRPALDTTGGAGPAQFTSASMEGPTMGPSLDELSGHALFWRLAGRCIDGYNELKQDTTIGHTVSMEFHSEKDDLHLEIVPREFRLDRTAGRNRVTYHFTLRATVVGPAKPVRIPSPDKDLLSRIMDGISRARSLVQSLAATIDDATAALDAISRTISNVANVMRDVGQIFDNFVDFLDGTKAFLETPRDFITSATDSLEALAEACAEADAFPEDVAQAFRSMTDDLHGLVTAADAVGAYSQTWDAKADAYGDNVIGSRQFASMTQQALSATQRPPGTGATGSSVQTVFGGSQRPGDVRRVFLPRGSTRLSRGDWAGFEERTVRQGDTLQSLAAKHLGDARKWLDLAMVNGLRAPYISRTKQEGTLQVGSKISVPLTTARPAPDVLTTGEPVVGESQAAAWLGRDFELTELGPKTFGWRIDEASGSVDVHHVRGVDNLGQAIQMRFRTEQGHNILYPNVGVPRLVGSATFGENAIEAQQGVREQLQADPRVKRLMSFKFLLEADVLSLEADLVPIGFSSSRTISRTLT